MTAPDPRALARLLRQRQEMGHGPIFLEGMDREEALAHARRIGASQRPAASASFREAAGGGPGAAAAARPGRQGRPAGTGRGAAAGYGAGASHAAGPGAGVGVPVLPELPAEHHDLREAALACTRCRLHAGRTQAVFADGNPDARLMVVGEAPGAQEDQSGVPFVGPAGKLLDLMLASVGLSRKESVYICNVIKCRPPGNRNPRPDEIESCAPYLRRQIELVRPEVLLAVGTFSAQLLTGSELALGKLRGEVYSYEGVPLVVTYHPAALLRNAGWSRGTWDDLQLLRQVMDG